MKNRALRRIKLSRYATVLGAGGHHPSVYRRLTERVLDVQITVGKGEVALPVSVHVGRGVASVRVEVMGAGGSGGQAQNGSSPFAGRDHEGAGARLEIQSFTIFGPDAVGGATAP